MKKKVTVAVVLLVVLAIAGLVWGGWRYSDELLPAEIGGGIANDLRVTAVNNDTIELEVVIEDEQLAADLADDQVLGFNYDRGYVRLVGEPIEVDGARVRRSYVQMGGQMPSIGSGGQLEGAAFPAEPGRLGFEEVEIIRVGLGGQAPGWIHRNEGPRADDWVVYVHGRGATFAEAMRAAQATIDSGRSALVVSYLNSPGAPESPDGYGHFGDVEWQDLGVWLEWLVEYEEPASVVLHGYSQGGSVIAACLDRCEETEMVDALVLESPLISMQETLELQAAERGIPGPLVGPLVFSTKTISELRGGPHFANLEHLDRLAEADLPILVFHSRGDRTVPIEPSQQLVEADPDQVQLVEYEGGHVRAWNEDRRAYRHALIAYLDQVTPAPANP